MCRNLAIETASSSLILSVYLKTVFNEGLQKEPDSAKYIKFKMNGFLRNTNGSFQKNQKKTAAIFAAVPLSDQ